jgi:transcriptional regulator with XRE-family HTH domain
MNEEHVKAKKRCYRVLGTICRALRESKGLTIAELATLMNLSSVSVRRIEKGRSCPSPKTLVRLCEVLDVSLDDMVSLLPGRRISDATKIRLFDKIINLNKEE